MAEIIHGAIGAIIVLAAYLIGGYNGARRGAGEKPEAGEHPPAGEAAPAATEPAAGELYKAQEDIMREVHEMLQGYGGVS